MNSDFGGKTDAILCIMANISALSKKLEKEKIKIEPDSAKINVWEREKRKASWALEKRRVMA
jgi:hypothetical protein